VAEAGVIERYVSTLEGRLRGPRHVKVDLLAEARDSLDDAAESYREDGLTAADAERRAVDEFGPLNVVAHEYQSELAATHGANTVRGLLFVIPLAHVLWELNRMFWIGSWSQFGAPPPQWYIAVAKADDTITWVIVAGAAVALVAGRLLSRRGISGMALGRLFGAVAVGCVAAALFSNVALVVSTAHVDLARLMMPAPMMMVTLVFYVVIFRLGVLARRCLVFSSV
jgi:hypothetical protein